MILQDLDSLHLYREELGHVCQPRNIESGQRTDGKAGSERTLGGGNNHGGSSGTHDPIFACASEHKYNWKLTRNFPESPRVHDPQTFSSFMPKYSLPIDIAASTTREPLRGVGATVAVLLEAADAHRNAGVASQNVAAELERLVDGLAGRPSSRKGGTSEDT